MFNLFKRPTFIVAGETIDPSPTCGYHFFANLKELVDLASEVSRDPHILENEVKLLIKSDRGVFEVPFNTSAYIDMSSNKCEVYMLWPTIYVCRPVKVYDAFFLMRGVFLKRAPDLYNTQYEEDDKICVDYNFKISF